MGFEESLAILLCETSDDKFQQVKRSAPTHSIPDTHDFDPHINPRKAALPKISYHWLELWSSSINLPLRAPPYISD